MAALVSDGARAVTDTPIDMTRSIPPIPESFAASVADTLQAFAKSPEFHLHIRNGIAGGSEADRRAGIKWLQPRFGSEPLENRLFVTNGTQSAIQLLFEHLIGKDGVLLAEELSYAVLTPLAARSHLKVCAVRLDDEGIDPNHMEELCSEHRPRALYCNPTVQNPTTATMSYSRRLQVAEVARKYDVAIIEDEPLGRLHVDAPPPIAAIAPDVTWYVMGLTKCIAHGLRLAYVVGPDPVRLNGLLEPVRRLSHWFPSPLAGALATTWIENGVAEKLCSEIREESVARQQIAKSGLDGFDIASPEGAMHLWLRLPDYLDVQRLVAELGAVSVAVRPASLFAVEGAVVPSAIRLSLSSPARREDVEEALVRIRRLIADATKSH